MVTDVYQEETGEGYQRRGTMSRGRRDVMRGWMCQESRRGVEKSP